MLQVLFINGKFESPGIGFREPTASFMKDDIFRVGIAICNTCSNDELSEGVMYCPAKKHRKSAFLL